MKKGTKNNVKPEKNIFEAFEALDDRELRLTRGGDGPNVPTDDDEG